MKEFKGIFPYLISAVNEDGSVREEAMRQLVEYLIGCGVHGLVALGSTGEFFYLNFEQRKEIVRIVVDQAAGRVPVIAGVAAASVLEARRQAREMEQLGADGILAILNVYFPLGQNEIYTYFAGLADAVQCPVVLYNNPKYTNFEISVETLIRLSEIRNIQYYKDASANTGRLFELSCKVGGRLTIFSASSHVPVFVMMMGGAGWMAGPSCVIPKQSVELYELCCAERWEEAIELQRQLWKLNVVFQKYGLAACIKGALVLQGFDVGGPIAPTKQLEEGAWREIECVLTELFHGAFKVK